MGNINFEKADEILNNYGRNPASLIAIMQDVQSEYRYLPPDVLEYIAKGLDISIAKVYSVATFYENFSLEPKGKYVIRICDGTACHVRKSLPILEAMRKELALSEKKLTTEDMFFTLETVSCLGACGLAPVMTINDVVYSTMTPNKALSLLNGLREGNNTDE